MLACILQGCHTIGSAPAKHGGPSSAWVTSSGRVERSLSREGFTWLCPGGSDVGGYDFFFWLCWALVAARGLSLVSVRGATLCCRARASHCGDFFFWGAQAVRHKGSVVAAHTLSSLRAGGIFPAQGSNPCPLYWQADSYPLDQGSQVGMILIPPQKKKWCIETFIKHLWRKLKAQQGPHRQGLWELYNPTCYWCFLLSMEVKAALYLRFQEECLFSMVGGLGKTKKQSSQPVGMCMIQDSPSESLPWDDKSEAEWWKDGRKRHWSSFMQWAH